MSPFPNHCCGRNGAETKATRNSHQLCLLTKEAPTPLEVSWPSCAPGHLRFLTAPSRRAPIPATEDWAANRKAWPLVPRSTPRSQGHTQGLRVPPEFAGTFPTQMRTAGCFSTSCRRLSFLSNTLRIRHPPRGERHMQRFAEREGVPLCPVSGGRRNPLRNPRGEAPSLSLCGHLTVAFDLEARGAVLSEPQREHLYSEGADCDDYLLVALKLF